MKAEQRKVLETNTLADKMGQVVQTVKGGTRKSILIGAGVAAVVIVGSFLGYRWYVTDRLEASAKWVSFYDGARAQMDILEQSEGEAGKAARFQIAWFHYWELGVKALGANQQGALDRKSVV